MIFQLSEKLPFPFKQEENEIFQLVEKTQFFNCFNQLKNCTFVNKNIICNIIFNIEV